MEQVRKNPSSLFFSRTRAGGRRRSRRGSFHHKFTFSAVLQQQGMSQTDHDAAGSICHREKNNYYLVVLTMFGTFYKK